MLNMSEFIFVSKKTVDKLAKVISSYLATAYQP